MKLLQTCKLFLEDQNGWLRPLVEAYTKAYNFVSKIGYENQISNGVELHHKTYSEVRKYLPSQLAISSRMKASESLKPIVKDLKNKNKIKNLRCPESKQVSIRYDKNSYTLFLENKEVSLLTLNGRKRFRLNIPEYFENKFINDSGWKHKSAELKIYGNKISLHIVFEKNVFDVLPNGEIIGIDRGINNLAVCSNNKFYSGKKIRRISNKYSQLRSQLQSIGSRSAQRHLVALGDKERRFRADVNHCISKEIVSGLNPGDTIVLENLKGIRKNRKLRKKQKTELNKWNFYQLEQFITYKAMATGVAIAHVDAFYTSQRCSNCGHTEEANRKNQSEFHCQKCGFRNHADLNASKNIRDKFLFPEATCFPEKVALSINPKEESATADSSNVLSVKRD